MKSGKVIAILAGGMMALSFPAFAQSLDSRESKMERYEILYGDAEPESIRPALASETESMSETGMSLSQTETEEEAEETSASTDGGQTGDALKTKEETWAWHPEFDEDKLYLPEAIKRLEESAETDQDAELFLETLRKMRLCQGTYIHEGTYDKDSVYTAEVEIFLKQGIPTCVIDYTGYVGFLEESEVIPSSTEEYMFETWPIGKMAGAGQEFYIQFDEKHMHITWGEGTVEYDLVKTSGDANELNPEKAPFVQSELYKTLMDKIRDGMGDSPYTTTYDEETKTLTIYMVLYENGRQKALNNASLLRDRWDSVLDSLAPVTESISTALRLGTRDGLSDFSEAHCIIMIVDQLKDNNTYYPQETWAVIQDGKVEYDFLENTAHGTDGLQGTGMPKAEETQGMETGGMEAGAGMGSGNSEPAYSASSGERNALEKAKSYLDVLHFSYSGLVEQLEYEGFTHTEAVYGADHCGADWYEQAAGKAKDYLDTMSFSYDGLVEQLEYEGFTHEQAVYGANQEY